jgi:choline kinase
MSRFVTNITTSNKNKTKPHNVDITVAILSAGIGSRIKSYEPRSMLRIGDMTLLEHQISTINNCFNNPEIIGVIGYDSQKIIKRINNIRIIENQLYETTNASESLRLAFNNTTKGAFLFMHGDLLFNNETLQNLDYSKSFVIVDNMKKIGNKEVGITISSSKKASIFSYGLETKWCQIAYLTGKEIKIARNIFNRFEQHNKKMLSFEILNKMIEMGASFSCHEPKQMEIIEIDRIKDVTT